MHNDNGDNLSIKQMKVIFSLCIHKYIHCVVYKRCQKR